MNVIDTIAEAVRRTGYREEAIVRDYAFADVLDPGGATRTVSLAAFTQTPPSYRSAALAAVHGGHGATLDWVNAYRSLGAPLLFVTEHDQVSLWQMRADAPPSVRDRVPLSDVPLLFERHRDTWRPDAIHRAKAIGAVNQEYQLDFVDIGLMPAVEGEIHLKLDRLLTNTLEAASQVPNGELPDTRRLFRIVFRLLAAKVLQDRSHPSSRDWDAADLSSVLRAIESYYSLPMIPGTSVSPAFSAAWDCLRQGISFSNISSEDLAFVYENTLVTSETRDEMTETKESVEPTWQEKLGIKEALLHGPEQIAEPPAPVAVSPGAVCIRHPERGHLVEDLASNSVFNSLPRQRSSPHLGTDDRLVAIDRVLHHASLGAA